MDQGGYNRGGYGIERSRGQGRGGRGGGDQQHGRGYGGGGRRGGYQTEGSAQGYSGEGRGRGRGPPQRSTSAAPAPAWRNPVPVVTPTDRSVRPWGQPRRPLQQEPPVQSFDESPLPDIQYVSISASQPVAVQENSKDKILPIRRPDEGGIIFRSKTKILANHFKVGFNSEKIILHYDVEIKYDAPQKRKFTKPVPKSDLRVIREELFTKDPERFPMGMTVYDGGKNIFSAVELPVGDFKVTLSDGEDGGGRSYIFSIQLVNKFNCGKLDEYVQGEVSQNPRDLQQGMDLVMKENTARTRICLGRSSFSKDFRIGDDLHYGIAAFRGFQQSLKPTRQGLALCLDYTVLAFRKRLSVLDFLHEHIQGFSIKDMNGWLRVVSQALVGLKVTVHHRQTKQRYTIAGITKGKTRNLSFPLEDREGNEPPKDVKLVDYFLEKYGKQIQHMDIPCLDVGKNMRVNYLPMEFCTLVDGQRFPKENLDKYAGNLLKEKSLVKPSARMAEINSALMAPES